MIPEKRSKANAGVGIGIDLKLSGLFMSGGATASFLGGTISRAGTVVFIRGCRHYAQEIDHSK